MRVRLIAAVALVVASAMSVRMLRAAPDETPIAVEESGTPNRSQSPWLGSASCSAMACHGDDGPPGAKGCEFSTWAEFDPHARASSVLYDPRSKDMMRLLGREGKQASEDRQCLACHGPFHLESTLSTNESKDVAFDAVGCEACHGPARDWINDHMTRPWRRNEVTTTVKANKGMNDLDNPVVRVEVCLKCHVGTGSQQVDHDLIAAGHPRLNFEVLAYTLIPPNGPDSSRKTDSSVPRGRWHYAWKQASEPIDPSQRVRAWAIGQIASAAAALDLLAERLNPKHEGGCRPWPELAEFDCFSCHQSLKGNPRLSSDGPRNVARSGAARGTLAWGSWYGVNLDAIGAASGLAADGILSQWRTIRKEVRPNVKNRPELAKQAVDLASGLRAEWIPRVLSETIDSTWVRAALEAVIADARPRANEMNWDEAAQIHTALAVLIDADRRMNAQARPMPATTELFDSLLYPPGFDSPDTFNPSALANLIQELDNRLSGK